MSSERRTALGKFFMNFALLYLGTGVVTKFFGNETIAIPKFIFALLTSPILVIIGLYLHTKE